MLKWLLSLVNGLQWLVANSLLMVKEPAHEWKGEFIAASLLWKGAGLINTTGRSVLLYAKDAERGERETNAM